MTNIWQQKGNISAAKRVFVGLSGGVDSAVSASLLQKAGYEVTGVFIKIQIPGYSCPAAQDRLEAMRVAAHLRIPFREVDLSREYEAEVFRPAVSDFKAGYTPNPDTLCNEKIKFGAFYAYARGAGADFVATGHYARTEAGHLYAASDKEKDQSYFLWGMRAEALAHTLFPVGDLPKTRVRRLAKKFGLPNAQRKDSQGLCFLGDISIEDMLMRETAPLPGSVLNESGEVVGEHRGVALYTLGQRHGFVLFTQTPATAPSYVVDKNLARNTLTVSASRYPRNATRTRLQLRAANYFVQDIAGPAAARYRYRGALIPAQAESATTAVLAEPHYVPLGQSLVLYRGEEVLGGGVVESATLE